MHEVGTFLFFGVGFHVCVGCSDGVQWGRRWSFVFHRCRCPWRGGRGGSGSGSGSSEFGEYGYRGQMLFVLIFAAFLFVKGVGQERNVGAV